jgi:hypothetical protein
MNSLIVKVVALLAAISAVTIWHFREVHSAEADGHERGASEVAAKWDQERQRITAAALTASELARQKEAAYVTAVESTREHYARESDASKVAAARAASELGRLRVAVANARPAGSGVGRCGGAGPNPPPNDHAAVDAPRVDETAPGVGVLLIACGEQLQDVARVADELGDQVRGLQRHTESLLEHIAGQPPIP